MPSAKAHAHSRQTVKTSTSGHNSNVNMPPSSSSSSLDFGRSTVQLKKCLVEFCSRYDRFEPPYLDQQTASSAGNLISSLTNSTAVRMDASNFNADQITEVKLFILPQNLISVQENLQSMLLTITLMLTWIDPRLQWDMGRLNNTYSRLHIDSSLMWLPDLAVDDRTFVNSPFDNDVVFAKSAFVDPNGRVTIKARYFDHTACSFTSRLFPFDKQRCALTFHNYDVHVKFNVWRDYQSASPKSYEDSGKFDTGEWRITRNSFNFTHSVQTLNDNVTGLSSVTYSFNLVRRFQQHVWLWVALPFLLSAGAVLALYLGCDSGERYSFGAAIVITLMLMLAGISDQLAVSRDGVPLVVLFFLGLCFTVILATFLSTLPYRMRKALVKVHPERVWARRAKNLVLYATRFFDLAMMSFCLLFQFVTLLLINREWLKGTPTDDDDGDNGGQSQLLYLTEFATLDTENIGIKI